MLAVVFSMACSRAMVAEPKPTLRFLSLNLLSWREEQIQTDKIRILAIVVFIFSQMPKGKFCIFLCGCCFHTSCNSYSVENLCVIPLTRLEKENDPFPYLKRKEKEKKL